MEISKYKKIGLDTNIFAYHFSKNPKYFSDTFKLFSLIESGKITAYVSTISLLEILSVPELQTNNFLQESYKNFFLHFPNLNLVPVDLSVAVKAAELRRLYQIKTPDSILLATAIINEVDVFITNDLRLKQVKEIKILTW